jgi:hypothetical protein
LQDVAVAVSTGDGERQWHRLAELAQEEESPEKRFVILQELCTEFAALQRTNQRKDANAQAAQREHAPGTLRGLAGFVPPVTTSADFLELRRQNL